MTFYVYENWRNSKAMIHVASCSHCKDGAGQQGGTRPENGRWHPCTTYEEARRVALRTGQPVKDCGSCAPATAH